MRNLLLCIFCIYVVVGCANQNSAMASSQPRTETCRDALFPLPGIRPAITFDSKESLYICLTQPGTPDVAYQIYVNGKKAFKVLPENAKHFNVFIANTYSVSCTDPREMSGGKDVSALPKIDAPVEIDTSHPICIVSTEINNRLVRAAFVFDTFDRAHASAIFELIPEERQKHDALKAVAGESGCQRNFNQDGSPTACLKQFEQERRACPSFGQSCFDPALAGAWIQKVDEGTPIRKVQKLIPGIRGWIVRPNGDVRPLVIDFKTGLLAEGPKDLQFSRISYGCNGELYQETFVSLSGGFFGTYCGRYTFDDKNLGISKNKSDGFQYYEPVVMGTKYMEPIHFDFAARFGEQRVSVPHVGTKLPAYAIAEGSGDRHRAIIQVFGDNDKFHFYMPNLSQAGRYTGTNAGKVSINQDSNRGFYTKDDPPDPNEITIDVFDTTNGRISGRFSYTVENKSKSLRAEGRFDIPLYILNEN